MRAAQYVAQVMDEPRNPVPDARWEAKPRPHEPGRLLRRVRRSLPLLAAMLSTTILAMGLSGLAMLPGGPLPMILQEWAGTLGISGRLSVPSLSGVLELLITLALWVALPVSLLHLLISRESRRYFLRTLRTLIGILALLILIRAGRGQGILPGGNAAVGGLGVSALVPPAFVTDPPRWVGIVISVVLGALVVLAAWWIMGRVGPPEMSDSAELSRAAHEALDRIVQGEDLKGVIYWCYAEMSRAVRGRWKIQRRAAMTPREFQGELIAAGLPALEVGRLTWLFEEVRYGARVFGDREETEAVTCLRAIVDAGRERA